MCAKERKKFVLLLERETERNKCVCVSEREKERDDNVHDKGTIPKNILC